MLIRYKAIVFAVIGFFLLDSPTLQSHTKEIETRTNSTTVKRWNLEPYPVEWTGPIVRPPLNDDSTCPVSLQMDHEKVASYVFPGADEYSDLLTGPVYAVDKDMPRVPVFLSGFSSNHFKEGLAFIKHINTVARKNFNDSLFIIYNLGLTPGEKQKLQNVCNCEVRDFPFYQFPWFVKELNTYTFKPVLIQLAVREYPFVMWMDTSTRFTNSDLQPLFDRAINLGILITHYPANIAQQTHPGLFRYLGEMPCTFKNGTFILGGYSVIAATQFVREYFLKPWVLCALSLGCMKPEINTSQLLPCWRHGEVYHGCHRFDQSMLDILMNRLYYGDLEQHFVKTDFMCFAKRGWQRLFNFTCPV